MDSAGQKKLCAAIGIIIIYFVLVLLPTPEGMTPPAQKAIALMLCAVLTWVFEVLPIAVSAILVTL